MFVCKPTLNHSPRRGVQAPNDPLALARVFFQRAGPRHEACPAHSPAVDGLALVAHLQRPVSRPSKRMRYLSQATAASARLQPRGRGSGCERHGAAAMVAAVNARVPCVLASIVTIQVSCTHVFRSQHGVLCTGLGLTSWNLITWSDMDDHGAWKDFAECNDKQKRNKNKTKVSNGKEKEDREGLKC